MPDRIILIECPDEKGLIYNITKVIYKHNLNVTANQEFVDQYSNTFFMRTMVEGNGWSDEIESELNSVLPNNATVRVAILRKNPLVILATKEPHCLGEILLKNRYGELESDVRAVVSNHDHLRSLAESFNIPFHHVPVGDLSREQHEEKILEAIAPYDPEYLVLAKYMRIFTPGFVKQFPNRIINIHHSFLPAFIGASPYQQAYDRGVKIIGATAHFVTEDLDEGPIIAQDVMPVNHTYTAKGMAQAGQDVEKQVLTRALKLVLEERVFIYRHKTILFE
ncbi:formyltetrahydrofolate deformylase [Rhodohalobacter sp. SW132]|uniref:formyltetrahydrofolate deformylase n=1 Tax=Rhodohalobacter sp. SW132 TaxID=2293433 RepID=UPI000E26F203|nr:formyltetrahydrofolate deformylase [Rhodohalobacter sp. SW132]REL25022.1 formyltetrahydrofolate deformylase [Rhodohalobacter sp. SW132]